MSFLEQTIMKFSVTLLVGILCLSLFSVLALTVEAQQSTIDWWPTFHHDLTHAGYSTSTSPNTNQILWNYTTGGPVYASPAVADGIVYVGSIDGKFTL